jgi:hypothetical protein
VLACWAGACASTAAGGSRAADAASVTWQTLPQAAATCGSDGPNVVAAVVGFLKGKPPHNTFEVELHVRNPLNRPIWLVPAMDESIPLKVDTVSVFHTPWGGVGPLWSFGSGGVDAVRVAPGADFNLSGVQFSSIDPSDLMTVSVLDEVRLDGRPAVDWVGKRTGAAGSGDIDLRAFRESDEIPAAKGARLELQVRCTQRIDVHDPKLERPESPAAR